jgi:Flp pilus assembly protein TadD
MAEPGAAVLCTSCGARNKAKWEFCARCGEPLVDATAETLVPRSARAPAKAAEKDEVLLGPDASPWNGPIAFVILIALTGVIAACWRTAKEGVQPVEAKPGVLTLATLPPTAPPAVATSARGDEAFRKGKQLALAGNPADAIAFLAQAVAEGPENAEYHAVYGQALWAMGSKDEALAQTAEAARLDPAAWRVQYASMLDFAGQKAQATAEYEAIIESQPTAEMLLALGQLASRNKDYGRAVTALTKAAEMRSADPKIAKELGIALEASGDRAGASRAFAAVLQADPADVAVRGRLAENLLQQGNAAEAINVYQAGLQRDPQSAELKRGLGGVLERAGRVNEAIAAYREYAQLAPNAPDAQTLVKRAAALEARGAAAPQ